jgi:hypothetical protein
LTGTDAGIAFHSPTINPQFPLAHRLLQATVRHVWKLQLNPTIQSHAVFIIAHFQCLNTLHHSLS